MSDRYFSMRGMSTLGGTAAIARRIASRPRPQVPYTITDTTTRLISGSIQLQPVNRMTRPLTATAAEIAASAAMWRNAPRTFRSSLLPRMKSHAEKPFTTSPSVATMNTSRPATGAGFKRRWIDSSTIAPHAKSNSAAFASDARIDELPRPNV